MVKLAAVSFDLLSLQHTHQLVFPGITHTEITQIAFVRTLARYLLETKALQKYEVENQEYTIDELYALTYSDWSKEKLHLQTYPLKSVLDTLLVENAMVDIDQWTKKLPAAHFDSEAFSNASRRMIKMRRISKIFSPDLPKKDSFCSKLLMMSKMERKI